MRPVLQRVWRVAEETGCVETVTAEWQRLLGDDFEEANRYLRVLGVSTRFPCPSPGSRHCPRRVIERGGRLQAVCNDTPRACEPVFVTKDDLVLREVRMEELAGIAARTLGLEPNVSTSRPGGEIWSLGSLALRPGADIPAFFYSGRHTERFDRAVGRLLRGHAGAFLLVAARSLLASPDQTAGLRRRKCVLLAAEDVWCAADQGEHLAIDLGEIAPAKNAAGPTKADLETVGLFQRNGKRWCLTFRGESGHVPHSVGMDYIAMALTSPRQEIASAILVGGEAAAKLPPPRSIGERLDTKAKAAYKKKLDELEDQIVDARELRNDEAIERLEDERSVILRELKSATAFGGKTREDGDMAERLRQRAAKAIRRAMANIEAELPLLGKHLRASLQLGYFVSYVPESDVTWRV